MHQSHPFQITSIPLDGLEISLTSQETHGVAEGNIYDVKVAAAAVGMVKAALTNVCIICQINTDIQLQS